MPDEPWAVAALFPIRLDFLVLGMAKGIGGLGVDAFDAEGVNAHPPAALRAARPSRGGREFRFMFR